MGLRVQYVTLFLCSAILHFEWVVRPFTSASMFEWFAVCPSNNYTTVSTAITLNIQVLKMLTQFYEVLVEYRERSRVCSLFTFDISSTVQQLVAKQ